MFMFYEGTFHANLSYWQRNNGVMSQVEKGGQRMRKLIKIAITLMIAILQILLLYL